MNLSRLFLLLVFLGISGEAFSLEGDTYSFEWLDPDKEVYVLQNRKYRKKGRLYFNAGGGITTSGAFVESTALQGRVGYFARESLGFEFIYSKNNGKENDTAKSVREDGTAGSIPFRRIVDNYMGGMLLWAPFYTKINTFNQIIYADWLLGLGYAKLEENNNETEVLQQGAEPYDEINSNHNGILWNLGMKIYLTRSLEFRVDMTTVFYQAEQIGGSDSDKKIWYSNWDAIASLGYSF